MSDFTTKDLDDLVSRGLAEKRGDAYYPTDLAKVISYATHNLSPHTLPPGGVRYMGYNITTMIDLSTGELIFNFARAMQ